jgi:hypothetical protein
MNMHDMLFTLLLTPLPVPPELPSSVVLSACWAPARPMLACNSANEPRLSPPILGWPGVAITGDEWEQLGGFPILSFEGCLKRTGPSVAVRGFCYSGAASGLVTAFFEWEANLDSDDSDAYLPKPDPTAPKVFWIAIQPSLPPPPASLDDLCRQARRLRKPPDLGVELKPLWAWRVIPSCFRHGPWCYAQMVWRLADGRSEEWIAWLREHFMVGHTTLGRSFHLFDNLVTADAPQCYPLSWKMMVDTKEGTSHGARSPLRDSADR